MISKRLLEGWEHYRGSLGGIWEVWRGDKLQNHFNVPWDKVDLPHCFNAEDAVHPDLTYYQGPGWYRTRLHIDNPYPNGRTLLHFEGAGQRSEVYVYTEKVGSHLGGYDEFFVDITEAVGKAKTMERYRDSVPIAVLCDNSRDLEMIPSDASDFNLYGGLYRYVNLVYVPAISVEQLHIIPHLAHDGNAAQAEVRATLYNPHATETFIKWSLTIEDPDGNIVHQLDDIAEKAWSGAKVLTRFDINKPQLWSPSKPQLYRCILTIHGNNDETVRTEHFGLRNFEFKQKGPFYLNGKRLLLQGTHRHEDFAGVGAAMTEDMILEEMKLIKEMGANFIRLGHYQQSRIVLDACDELGLLVWEEIPWCRGGLGGERYRQQCKDMLTAMITQHMNHPSVILWGLGNENDWECDFDYFDQDEIRSFMKELHDLAHHLDPTRLTAIRRCDFCKDIVDVYSPSIWAGWYRGIYTEYEAYNRTEFEKVDHMLHTEWGADNLAGRHVKDPFTGMGSVKTGQGADERDGDYLLVGGQARVSRDGDWSETYFCDMIDWYLKSQAKMDWLTGSAQWAFKDFSTPVRPENPIPYMNMKGIVQRDGTKKEAYYVFQSYWAEKPMVHLYGHTMPVRWGAADEPYTLKVYSNCPKVKLTVNGTNYGWKSRNIEDFPAAGLRWDVLLQPGANHIIATAEGANGETIVDEVRFEYQVETWAEPAQIKLTAKQVEEGLYRVEAKAYDAAGVFCPDADAFVRFRLAGKGRLREHLGTATGSSKIGLANGRAVIYAEAIPEETIVSISSEFGKTTFITI